MRISLLVFLTLAGMPAGSWVQTTISAISPAALYQQIQSKNRPAIVQFWVPNCSVAAQILGKYNTLTEQWGSKTDFYFIGLTNKPELVKAAALASGYKGVLYIADTVSTGPLQTRRERFSEAFSRLAGKGKKQWLTLHYSPEKKKYRMAKKSLKMRVGRVK